MADQQYSDDESEKDEMNQEQRDALLIQAVKENNFE